MATAQEKLCFGTFGTLCGIAGGIFLCTIYIEEQKSVYDREVLFTK